MSMPRLFKRLGKKSLKRSQSLDAKLIPDDRRSTSPPPLPHVTISSASEALNRLAASPRRSYTEPPPLPKGIEGNYDNTETVLSPVPSPNAEEHGVLASAWDVANTIPTLSKTDEVLQKIETEVSAVQDAQGNNAVLINSVSTVSQATGGLETIEKGVINFMEGSAILMKSLDEVAKLHPFIGVAVMAFKAVWTLEMKRRNNDKRIIVLHVEMKDMMTVLIQLKNVKDPTEVAPDGTTIAGRMQELAKVTADDIKDCANACDTYSKKKLIVKVIQGPIWECKLLDFVGRFTKRRSEFEFALTIHTARGVDAANQTLSDVKKTTDEVNVKMDMMMKMFERFVLPEQKEMALLIQKKGGEKACQGSDKILQELNEFEKKTLSSSATAAAAVHMGRRTAVSSDFDELKADLHAEPDEAMAKNMSTFSRKFEIQKRQITEEVSKAMRREGDRIINAVTSGPHEKIIDPDVSRLWKEMNWRGSVKARHFVMALRDYFHEKWSAELPEGVVEGAESTSHPVTDPHRRDDWALTHLNAIKLQPISEAFDDDASGFITVAEVNTFTSSRPLGWSLPHWIAYWAIGWHMTLIDYADKIHIILAKMFAILPTIKPENRNAVNDYLQTVYHQVVTLKDGLYECPSNDALRMKFKSYVDSEEERLRLNLKTVDFDIDALDTLALVTGPGRIEKFVLPLIYLLLKHHFEIFRFSQTRIMHRDELWDAAETVKWVFDAVSDRVDLLQSIFKQQKLDLKHQFQTFAHGMFEYCNEPSGLWAPEIVRAINFSPSPYEDKLEEQNLKAEDFCNYPLDEEELYYAAYDFTPSDELSVPAEANYPIKFILGPWNGAIYRDQGREYSSFDIISFTLSQGAEENHFQASARAGEFDFKITGSCSPVETQDQIAISFKRTFTNHHPPQYWYGRFDPATDTITGTVSFNEDRTGTSATFVLKRTPSDQLRFRPPPAAFEGNKARTLWTYALSVTRAYVHQQSWSKTFFHERRDTRKRFIQLYIRSTAFGKPLDEAENAELKEIRLRLTTADSRFYHSLALHQIRITVSHGRYCDACRGSIGGSLIFCMVCQTKDTFDSVDLCDEPSCMAARVERNDLKRPHLPTHDLAKVRRVVHTGQVGQVERTAKTALERARELIGDESICIVCKDHVTQPCWYCVECEDGSFICYNCDAKALASPEKIHEGAHDYHTHTLVRCQKLVKDAAVSVEERLASLEAKFAGHEEIMNDRLLKLEKLLEVMHEKLAVEAS